MKSLVYKSLLLSGALAPAASAFSLYDSAPAIGVPESYAVRYSAYMNVGYDDNRNCSEHNAKGGGFVRFGLTAAYADYESVTKISYNARVGAQLYNKDAHGTDHRLFSDISLSAALTHSITPTSLYSLRLGLTFTPQPEYSNGISGYQSYGDCVNWNISNSYSQALDERWSWNAELAFSGNIYLNSAYAYDDRYYFTLGTGLSYRASERTSYGINLRARYELRNKGYDSTSYFLTGSVTHALSPISSCSLSGGIQAKVIDGGLDVYPTLSASYRRVLMEGLSANAYLSLSNENVSTYSYYGNYKSDMTWRAGVTMRYAYTPKVAFRAGVSLIDARYSKGTNNLPNRHRTAVTLSVGMDYVFTENLTGTLDYSHTLSDGKGYDYNRNIISAGLRYSF